MQIYFFLKISIILACCEKKLNEIEIKWKKDNSICIVLCSDGYPEKYKKNVLIKNLEKINTDGKNYCFHAGTNIIDKKTYAVGGRVLNFVSLSSNFSEARKKIFDNLNNLNWNEGFYRKDIGYKVIDK